MMETLPTLTRLIFVGCKYDYAFRTELQTGIRTGKELITLDDQEWAPDFSERRGGRRTSVLMLGK